MVKVGDKVSKRVVPTNQKMVGTVIYVHPSQSWYRAEFVTENGGKFREAFFTMKLSVNF